MWTNQDEFELTTMAFRVFRNDSMLKPEFFSYVVYSKEMSQLLTSLRLFKNIPAFVTTNMKDINESPSDSHSQKNLLNEENKLCRICFGSEESSNDDTLKIGNGTELKLSQAENPLLMPCGCSGSVAYVHKHCLRRWRIVCDEDGSLMMRCELCHQAYKKKIMGHVTYGPVHLAFMLALSTSIIAGQHILNWIIQQSLYRSDFISYMLTGSSKQNNENLFLLDMAWLVVLSAFVAQMIWSYYPKLTPNKQQTVSSLSIIPNESNIPLLPNLNSSIRWSAIISASFIYMIDTLSLIPVTTLLVLLSAFHPVQAVAYLPDLLFKIAGCWSSIAVLLFLVKYQHLIMILALSPKLSSKVNLLPYERVQRCAVAYTGIIMILHVFNYILNTTTAEYIVLKVILFSMRTFVETILWTIYAIGSTFSAGILDILISDI